MHALMPFWPLIRSSPVASSLRQPPGTSGNEVKSVELISALKSFSIVHRIVYAMQTPYAGVYGRFTASQCSV